MRLAYKRRDELTERIVFFNRCIEKVRSSDGRIEEIIEYRGIIKGIYDAVAVLYGDDTSMSLHEFVKSRLIEENIHHPEYGY